MDKHENSVQQLEAMDPFAAGFRWLTCRPLLVVLIAHSLFSIGIWNARDGYGEETGFYAAIFSTQRGLFQTGELYQDLTGMLMGLVTRDPLTASTIGKYLSSLLGTLVLFFTLKSFSRHLRPAAIVFASMAWISCSLDAPFLQSTSLSLFTMAVMLAGVCFLLHRESVSNVIAFYVLAYLATAMRPEYYLALLLITLLLLAPPAFRAYQLLKPRITLLHRVAAGAIFSALVVAGLIVFFRPPAFAAQKLQYINSYLLGSFGQCYADYYHRTHPQAVFSSMTEWQPLLDAKFRHPWYLGEAIRHNPKEAISYFLHNAIENVSQIPRVLLAFRENQESPERGWPYRAVIGVIATGIVLAVMRFWRQRMAVKALCRRLVSDLFKPNTTSRRIGLLVLFASPALVSMPLLVGTPRYYIYFVPLFYVALAAAVTLILKEFQLMRFEPLIVIASGICFCAPNFLTPRPNQEMDAVRAVAPLVRPNPLVVGWWAQPDVIFGLMGQGKDLNATNAQPEDFTNGSVDIFMDDSNYRQTKAYADSKDFYQQLERNPEAFGFKKLTGVDAGRFDVYYRPK